MTPFKVLDLNDWELSVYNGSRLEVQMPGFALVEPKLLILGEQALAEHRREPLAAHFNYWHRLDASPIRSRNRKVRTSVDLVFNQLVQLIEKAGADKARVVLAVPSHYSKDQLAVLLGIFEQTSLAPLAIIDSSVAAGAVSPSDWVLDVSLHQMTLTRLERQTDGSQAPQLSRVTVESIAEGGLLPMLDAWLTRIADEFIQETRFDPLRIADTEQQLWSRLYDWVCGKVQAQGNGLHLEVAHQSGRWHVNFDVRELDQATSKLAGTIISLIGNQAPSRLALTSRAARLTSLVEHLSDSGVCEITSLSADALIQGISDNASLFEQAGKDGVKFVTSVSSRQDAPRVSLSDRRVSPSSPVSSRQDAPRVSPSDRRVSLSDRRVSPSDPLDRRVSPSDPRVSHSGPPDPDPRVSPSDRRVSPRPPAPTHLVVAGVAMRIGAPTDLSALIPELPANTYRIEATPAALQISDAGERLHSLACGQAADIGGTTVLAIRIADHGA